MLVGTIVHKDSQGDERRYALDSEAGFSVTGMTPAGAEGMADLLDAELIMRPYTAAEGEPGAVFLVEKARRLGGRVEWPPEQAIDPAAQEPIF